MKFEKGHQIGMLRVFQAAVVLMGGLLLIITGMVVRQRAEVDSPLYWMILCCVSENPEHQALYMLEPLSGKSERLTPYFYEVESMEFRDGWFYLEVRLTQDSYPSIFRMKMGEPAQLIVEGGVPVGFSPNNQWLVYAGPTWSFEDSHGLYSLSLQSGTTSSLTDNPRLIGYQLEHSTVGPQVSPDGYSIAFEASRIADEQSDIFVAGLGDGEIQNLTAAIDTSVEITKWLDEGLILEDQENDFYYQYHPQDGMSQLRFDEAKFGINPTVWFYQDGIVIIYDVYKGTVWAYQLSDMTEIWQQTDVKSYWVSPNGKLAFLEIYPNQWGIRATDSMQAAWFDAPVPLGEYMIESTVWSSKETRLVMDVNHLGKHEVWVADAYSSPKQVWITPEHIFGMWWSPDGKYIVSHTSDPKGYVFNFIGPNDKESKRIASFSGWESNQFAGWGPTIDRPMNGNALAGIGVLLGSIGVGMIVARFRKA